MSQYTVGEKMTSAQQIHESMVTALLERSFERLEIKRLGSICYLVITFDDEVHVFVDNKGERKENRHPWQARDWLMSIFNVLPDSMPVEKI